jgi:mevalonate kinase
LTIAGWQDAAVILETGLCVWRSGASPVLEAKFNPDFLQNKMALYWTGKRHSTLDISRRIRDLDKIASVVRHPSKWTNPMEEVVRMVEASYECQRDEGMDAIKKVKGMLASKYCGSGWGGYILYLFNSVDDTIWFCSSCDGAMAVEPYMRQL